MNIDRTNITNALKDGICRLPTLPPSAQALLGCQLPQTQLWIVDRFQALEELANSFRVFSEPWKKRVLLFQGLENQDICVLGESLQTVQFIQNNPDENVIIITRFQCLEQKIPNLGNPMLLHVGDKCPPDEIFQTLEELGYTLDIEVYEKGHAARRGGIIDIWQPTAENPVRIEFFGDEIDSLRTFDPATQCSLEKTSSIEIIPLNAQGTITLEELLPQNTLYLFSHVDAELLPNSIQIGCVTTNTTPLDLAPYETNLKPISEHHRPDAAEQQRKQFFRTLEKMVSKGWKIDIYMETEGATNRLREWLAGDCGHGIRTHIGLLHGSFICKNQKYLLLTEADIYGYTTKTTPVRKPQAVQQESGARVAEWTDIQPGELVVHADNGIGKYMGLMEINMTGKRQEMLLLEYADGARLYLPTGQAHLITRYTGLGNATPKLHSLKGKRWQNERISAQDAIEDLAARLLENQAARSLKKGRACGPDTQWQCEFENSFPYVETIDQLTAIDAIKEDLQSTQPMDRLICGDAGYGKTEVAMRAAFKMVTEGRQVAILVPTTVLAQQHLETFTERMAAFPICVEMLSRFRTHAEQNETITRLREGDINIIIGTHRLVSKDVQFNNLGLVVIDEEQRFGVRAKEYLKNIRNQADVLTMTATPIPRTLYMSLTGARDMSTIQTPPQERQPIKTIVLEYHDDVLREAILLELARDGQTFILHNRVQTIGKFSKNIEQLVPEARIEYAHGQMSEKQLSDIMHRFVRGLFDVLISTTIIESGVDIPRANTILVDRADRFGLSDLYQLRGRVGRSRKKAYAYLLLPTHGVLSDDARARIEALTKFSGLGAGFRIAMRDLEIRGAGNLLGAQQSGHIAAIGFDLYCQLLKRSVARLQGKKVPPLIDASVDLDFLDRSPTGNTPNGAYIPYTYIEDENLRVKLYGRIATLTTEPEIRTLKKEFADRFGKLPSPIKNLFKIARIRIAGAKANVQSIRTHEEKIILTRDGKPIMPHGRYPRLATEKTAARLKEILTTLKAINPENR